MKALVVTDFDKNPQYIDFKEPIPAEDEMRVTVSAATLAPIVKMIAKGAHYSGPRELPFVPGVDGVGRSENGERVYFLFPRVPFGSMAEFTVPKRRWSVRVPDEVDDVLAAAVPNSGLSSWIALKARTNFKPGQVVVVNGATGSAGSLAARIAKYLGASKVIATGRNIDKLHALKEEGADVLIPISNPDFDTAGAYREAFSGGVDVVLDYLGGSIAEEMLLALTKGKGSVFGEPPVRFVQIGASAGHTMSIQLSSLRSSGLEIVERDWVPSPWILQLLVLESCCRQLFQLDST